MEGFKKYLKGDRVIWGVIMVLSMISLLVVYSSISTLAYKTQGGSTLYMLFRHFMFLVAGWGMIIFILNIPYKYYSKIALVLIIVSVFLLLYTLQFGVERNDAKRWIRIPLIGLTMQTSDFAKISVIIWVARVLSRNQDQIGNFGLIIRKIIIPVSLICILILPEDFSTAAMLFGITMVMMFIGRVKVWQLSTIVILGVVIVGLFVMLTVKFGLFRTETIVSRMNEFFGFSGQESAQVVQSKIAITAGKFIGRGPGNSIQRYFLPNPFSDYIYAIIIEEYGWIGAITIPVLYLYLLFRTGIIVRKSTRTFPAFLAMGLALLIVMQAITNMAVAVDLFPVTGQPLPFVSLGGTSMVFTGIAFGIILGISREIEEQEEKIKSKTNESTQSTDNN